MDEVDIDNAEDLNELEARLYAQIHHEAGETLEVSQDQPTEQTKELATANENVERAPSCETANRPPSNRYWGCKQIGADKAFQQPQQNTKYRVRNQHKANTVVLPPNPIIEVDNSQSKDENINNITDKTLSRDISFNSGTSYSSCKDQHINNVRPKTPTRAYLAASVCPSKSVENNPKASDNGLKRFKNPFVRRANTKQLTISNANPKQGPFFKQQQKLEKLRRIENKKQKSKKALAKKQTAINVVDLVSSDESDSSDVVIIPIPPPPTYSLDDSDDEEKVNSEGNDSSILEQEENALDSTDVQLSTSSSFIKPHQISIQNLSTASGCEEKRLESSSRCTSPCSIQSSDDFIGQTDRSRLLDPGSGMADDEDLLLLTSDVNSLLETPQSGQHDYMGKDKSLDTSAEIAYDCQQFATPTTSSASRKSDYHVEGQFRAIDVYESESDITDSVYSKGTPKTTVIRHIDTSSDDVEYVTCSNPRTKRLRKRRRSSGNKSSDPINENYKLSSGDAIEDDDDSECNSGTERTCIPFISRGPAVERKLRKPSRTLLTCSPHMTPGRSSKSDHMSDGDFIAKLNDLVQGQDGEELDDSDETNNAPSAREIAEKILGKTIVTTPKETAVPKDVCNQLTDVFETIDHMEDVDKMQNGNTREASAYSSNTLNVGQSNTIVYRSLPEEDNAQIITFVDNPSPSVSNIANMTKRASNGSPIYNVVYCRGKKTGGGIGWNDEMRKFYQESWNGEGFLLSEIWKKMNPDRNLWKIYNEDRCSKPNKRHNNLKCTNCCEFGHARYQCKRPMKPPICYMCGESGHQEPRCPNTICLRCGNKTQVFVKGCNACSFQTRLICPICKIRGHSIDHCPDKWRRYHSTTEPNVFPNNTVEYNPRKYCSICGNRGHLADACRSAMHFMEYPPIATAVKSHQKSYNDVSVKMPFGGVGVNLMYEPFLKYSFDLSHRTTTNKYYGRFLNAVGMGFLMTRKRSMSPQLVDGGLSKKSRKVSKKNDRNTYNVNVECDAPNQVQEISESGSLDNERSKEPVCIVESTVPDGDIQLNIVNPATPTRSNFPNFKPPNKVTTSNNPPQIMDSDSNYSFSEHFDDVASTSNVSNKTDSYEMQKENTKYSAVSRLLVSKAKPKSREMETLPEFIPLVDPTDNCDDVTSESTEPRGGNGLRIGISRRFVAAESDDENKCNKQKTGVVAGLPCEAKIYLTHLHSKYLLSADGSNFLTKSSKSFQLKARLDFTSVGHVLVIFGLPDNQDKFQRELLMKYRELSDNIHSKHLQPTPNIPKRTDVLIRFLRDDINQLLTNLGNVNHLFKRLQYVERQQSKSGFKLADKIRRSLNMIIVGQAGLKEGNIHLDKLIGGLKTLINDYRSEDVTPLALRSEITAHWKVIFSSYRHDNYQELVENYNNLISKNRMPKLIIDPLLLGHKVLDTNLTAEQREKLEQPNHPSDTPPNSELAKPAVANNFTPKHSKQNKRKQGLGTNNTPNSPLPFGKSKMSGAVMSPASKSSVTTPIKSKSTASSTSLTPVSVSKKQQHKMLPPPPFANPEKRSTVTTGVTEFSDKWKTTCDTILTEITAKSTQQKGNNPVRDSKLPSTFWSRESLRYLDDCLSIARSRPELMEKMKRVQNKSKNGQLSYNDYLAVIKLHTALARK